MKTGPVGSLENPGRTEKRKKAGGGHEDLLSAGLWTPLAWHSVFSATSLQSCVPREDAKSILRQILDRLLLFIFIFKLSPDLASGSP